MKQQKTIFIDKKASSQNTTDASSRINLDGVQEVLDGKKSGLSAALGVGQVTSKTLPQVLSEVDKEVVKKEITSQIEAEKKLDQLVAKSQEIIFKASAFFPFDL